MCKIARMLFISMAIVIFQGPVFSQTIDRRNWYDAVQIEEEEYKEFMKLLLDGDEIINEILIRLNLVDLKVEYDGDQISVGWRIMWQNQNHKKP